MTPEDKATYLFKLKFSQYLFEKYGDKALRDIEDYEIKRMAVVWDSIGKGTTRSIRDLYNKLWNEMGSDFEYSIVKEDSTTLEIRCTKCPFHDLAEEVNMKEVIFSTFCMSDYGIVEGFNPAIKFERTKTLVEGHGYCNHKYSIK